MPLILIKQVRYFSFYIANSYYIEYISFNNYLLVVIFDYY